MGVLLGCGGLLFGLLIVLLVGSTIVRAAVSFANRVLGPPAPPDTFGQWGDWDSDDPAPAKARRGRRKIPEPGTAKGGIVTLLSAVVNVGGYAVCGLVAQAVLDDFDGPEGWGVVALAVFSLPLTFVVHALLLVLLLPTTFWRAVLVTFLHYLIVVVLVLGFGAAIYLVLRA